MNYQQFPKEIYKKSETIRDFKEYPIDEPAQNFIRIHQKDLERNIELIRALISICENILAWEIGRKIRCDKGKLYFDKEKKERIPADYSKLVNSIRHRANWILIDRIIKLIWFYPSSEERNERFERSMIKLYDRLTKKRKRT